jgi:signal transduction histidine kinase
MTLRRRDVELDEESRDRLLGIVANESDRLARIVNEILVADHLDSGRLRITPGHLDAIEAATTVVNAARVVAPESVEIDVEFSPEISPVAADPEHLRQVLVNLVDNAVKYSPDGGRIKVRIEDLGATVRFSVSDEGIGIPASEQPRVFDKFYRLDPNLTRGVGGTGLGLYICRELVRRMAGRIFVESLPGEGSTFAVELPVAGVADGSARPREVRASAFPQAL